MGEWQPIETAPKDGTRILTYSPEAVAVGYETVRINHWSEVLGNTWAMTNQSYWPPTHWMPLPEPPK